MAVPNEVRINIRHNVLLLKTFTIPQLQALTGFNRSSIYSEIKRMVKDELVSRVGTEKKEKPTGGRPPVMYQLTPDPEKRFRVLESVRAFFTSAEEQVSELPRPESEHYFIAKEILEESIEREASLTQDEKIARLDMIKKRLAYARQEEEVGEAETQLIAASFDALEAKAVEALAGDWKSAIKLLSETAKVYQQFEADDLVAELHQHVNIIIDRMTKKQLQLIDNARHGAARMIVQDLNIIGFCFSDLPGIRRSIEYADRIATMAQREWINAQVEQRAAQQSQALAATLNQRQTILIAQASITEEQKGSIEPGFEPQIPHSEPLVGFVSVPLHQLLRDAGAQAYRHQRFQLADVMPQLSQSVQDSEN